LLSGVWDEEDLCSIDLSADGQTVSAVVLGLSHFRSCSQEQALMASEVHLDSLDLTGIAVSELDYRDEKPRSESGMSIKICW
jgi:hypothetical protein